MARKPNPPAIDLCRYRDPILDSLNEGVFTVDGDWRITSFNRAAERITGVAREHAIGQLCCEVFRANICERDCSLRRAMSGDRAAPPATAYIVDAEGERIPIKISAAPLHDESGKLIGGVETFQDLRHIEALREQLGQQHRFADIVGQSPAMTRLFELLPPIAESTSTVLIEGPSGTGKELFARAIHKLSPRRNKPFVAINCAALPDTLLEAELFGYKAGAFTDAKRDKPGRFALAKDGTIFLDEIGDISPAMQARLLRVLQEKTFEPLGGLHPEKTAARVVAATNRDLRELMRQGSFREDLYYRIHVVHLEIPPLSERRQDLSLLVDHFVGKLNRLHERDIAGLSPEAEALLMRHDFPGNVRELQNILEHAFVLCRDGLIEPEHLPDEIRQSARPVVAAQVDGLGLHQVERTLILEALRKHDGNRGRAAQELGIDPSTLYRKIKRYGLEVPQSDGRSRSGVGS